MNNEKVRDCRYPWFWLMVTADGNAKPCCWASGSLGNVNDQPVDDVWNGATMVELREAIRRNEIHPVCAGSPCKFVQNMKTA